MLLVGSRERKWGERRQRREGLPVVQSQNTTDAKVAGMEEVGGRDKMRDHLLNLITCMDGQ